MEKIRNKTTNFYTEWRPLIDGLSDSDAGKLLKDILKYQSNEEVINTNPVWLFIKSKIDEYNNKLSSITEKRQKSGRLGGIAKASKCQQVLANDGKSSNKIKENKIKENKTNITKENIIKEKHPSLEDVKAYCIERKNNVDAERFIDYYTSNGWKVGKNPMKDWKAAVRMWERNATAKQRDEEEHLTGQEWLDKYVYKKGNENE